MKEIVQDDILITLATQLAITDIRRYILLKVGTRLLSIHVSILVEGPKVSKAQSLKLSS